MEKRDFAFGKLNFIITGVAVFLIILGFILMTGPGSSIEKGYNPDIFSVRRIYVAPVVCFIGFLMMIVAIAAPQKLNQKKEDNN